MKFSISIIYFSSCVFWSINYLFRTASNVIQVRAHPTCWYYTTSAAQILWSPTKDCRQWLAVDSDCCHLSTTFHAGGSGDWLTIGSSMLKMYVFGNLRWNTVSMPFHEEWFHITVGHIGSRLYNLLLVLIGNHQGVASQFLLHWLLIFFSKWY